MAVHLLCGWIFLQSYDCKRIPDMRLFLWRVNYVSFQDVIPFLEPKKEEKDLIFWFSFLLFFPVNRKEK